MKKIIILITILMLVGCSKKRVCNKNENNENTNITIISEKEKIKKIQIKTEFENEEEANNYCTLLKLIDVDIECNKNTIIYKNYKDYLDVSIENADELISYLNGNNYNCK